MLSTSGEESEPHLELRSQPSPALLAGSVAPEGEELHTIPAFQRLLMIRLSFCIYVCNNKCGYTQKEKASNLIGFNEVT